MASARLGTKKQAHTCGSIPHASRSKQKDEEVAADAFVEGFNGRAVKLRFYERADDCECEAESKE